MRRTGRRARWSAAAGALVLAVAVVVAGCAGGPRTPEQVAQDARQARLIVDQARMTMDTFGAQADMATFRDQAKRARGVLIVPQAVKAAFILGGGGGNAVLLARDPKTGAWNGPAFYTLGGASFGLQAGAEVIEAVALAMSERGVTKMLSPSVNLGADISVALGTVGAGVGAATAGPSADVVVYSLTKGVYGGMSLQGSVLSTRGALNGAFYGKPVTPSDILVRGEPARPEAQALIASLARVAGGP
jgi:lipid-binding SYLF domain-containing protein